MSMWTSGNNKIHHFYDKVYYRSDDSLSFEIGGDGKFEWYITNPKTHRVQYGGSEFMKEFPLYVDYRPEVMGWV